MLRYYGNLEKKLPVLKRILVRGTKQWCKGCRWYSFLGHSNGDSFGSGSSLIATMLSHCNAQTRVSDPCSFDTDPDPIRIQAFDDQKLKKNYSGIKNNFFLIENYDYLSLGFHKGRPSYRRSLQLSKENIQHFKTWKKFQNFLLFL